MRNAVELTETDLLYPTTARHVMGETCLLPQALWLRGVPHPEVLPCQDTTVQESLISGVAWDLEGTMTGSTAVHMDPMGSSLTRAWVEDP